LSPFIVQKLNHSANDFKPQRDGVTLHHLAAKKINNLFFLKMAWIGLDSLGIPWIGCDGVTAISGRPPCASTHLTLQPFNQFVKDQPPVYHGIENG
jgi:hypothetical protein